MLNVGGRHSRDKQAFIYPRLDSTLVAVFNCPRQFVEIQDGGGFCANVDEVSRNSKVNKSENTTVREEILYKNFTQ